jgi:uncharacterized protein
VLAASLVAVPPAGAELRVPPPPDRRINDYAGALAPAELDRLEQKLSAAEARGSNQVVVAIFPSLEGESLEDFSIRLAQAWRIGQKRLDNGVIFLVFVRDRKMRLEVGYGLEPTLPDATAASILRDTVAPHFREGKLADGVSAGLDAILSAIAGTYSAPAARRPGEEVTPAKLILVGVLAIVTFAIIASAMARSARSRRRGYTGGPRGWRHQGSWGTPIIIVPGGGPPDHGDPAGGRGGGFSGGGGEFGGGGASADW